jgi:hypothetical protein
MAIKYFNIVFSRALQNFPKLGFLAWKETIWQPRSEQVCGTLRVLFEHEQGDQIGRFFAHELLFSSDSFSNIQKVVNHFGPRLSMVNVVY